MKTFFYIFSILCATTLVAGLCGYTWQFIMAAICAIMAYVSYDASEEDKKSIN